MVTRTHGNLASAAAAYIGGSGDIVPRRQGDALEIRRQSARLCKWAQDNGCLIDYTPPVDAKRTEGAEHEVFFHQQVNRVFKRTYPGTFGSILTKNGLRRTATPYFYLRRLELTNEFFGSDLRLECVTSGDRPSIVVSQPWAQPADPKKPLPTPAEIHDFMTELDFEPVLNASYEWFRKSDGVRVSDARPDNFIKSENGVVPIDLVVSKE
jgi:hypothetical protein